MGITISYRGSLADLDRIEDFEDRVLDLALELGGQARIWRSTNDDKPQRMVRGVILNLVPGQETTSLLISPEGWLIGLIEIEEAEKGQLDERPWCFVKTQFGPIEGHVALIELLTALKKEFIPDLEVCDEGSYWETRDLAALTTKWKFLHAAIEGMREGLETYSLSDEAAEDPLILTARIERIAQLVHRTLSRPAEHPPLQLDDEEMDSDDARGDESQWDASYKENRRRQERVQRAIEEHLARGDDYEDAFDAAMLEETVLGLPEESPEDESFDTLAEDLGDEEGDAWRESLSVVFDENDEDEDCIHCNCHPLQQRVFDLMLRLHKLFGSETGVAGSHQDALLHGAGEMLGGLAQALGGSTLVSSAEDETNPFSDSGFQPMLGLSVVQLKRALRGAAFALGALFPLRTAGLLDRAAFDELHETIEGIQTDIFAELSRLRRKRENDS
jgi:hypothetical protein